MPIEMTLESLLDKWHDIWKNFRLILVIVIF